ncbi:MAG: T9SS type A sorting domain-containing protein, partial [Bacteroidetes bacterium]|nr:T9SS type A sorting domain-containing protein [Bacteroidota bacterium]
STERWVALNKLQLKEACLELWSTSEYIEVRDSLVIDATMTNNARNRGFGFNGQPGEQGGMYILMTGDKNGNIVSNGAMQGMYHIKINKNTSALKVVVTGNRQEIGSNTHYVDVTQGILEFDGKRNCRINANTVPTGLIVRSAGRLVAPDNDSLFFNGCWNFNNTNCFNAQLSTVVLDGKGNKSSFTHNQDTIYLNNLVLRTSGATAGTPASLTWNFTQDRLYLRGNLTTDDTAGAYLGNLQLFIEGNLTAKQTQGNTGNRFPDRVLFVGTNNQTVTLSSAAKAAYGNTVTFNKPSGSVTLNSVMEVRDVTFTSGLVNTTSTNKLIINRPDFIRGGNANSYVNGPVRVLNGGSSSMWNAGANTTGNVPVGAGGNYRPIAFSNAGNDEFDITYTASNAKSGETLSAPIDEITTTDLWRIDHVSGTSNYKIKLFLTGKPAAWNNTEVRIAAQADGNAPWYNQGGTYYSSDNMIWSTNVDITKGFMHFTHGRDVPAPMMLVKEGVSGHEVATVKAASNEVAPAPANKAVQFNVYPNPVKEQLFFQLQNADKGVVTLSDMSGKMLGMFNAAEVKTIDMSNLTPGMYLVSFTDGLNRITQRVVKNQ